MKKNYLLLILLFGLFAPAAMAQMQNEYVSVPNGTGPVVVIQDVLDNDMIYGIPATLSNAHFLSVSSTSNYLSLDEATGSVIFDNGPAPIGTYEVEYIIDQIGSSSNYFRGVSYVNIGCDAVNPPIVMSVNHLSCMGTATSVQLQGLPAEGWTILDFDQVIASGTGTSTYVTINNSLVSQDHELHVRSLQGCISPPAMVSTSLFTVAVTGTYVDTNADGIPSAGDVINYAFTVTNSSNCAANNVRQGLNNLASGAAITLPSGASNNSNFSYTRTLSQNNINAGVVFGNFQFQGNLGGTVTYYTARTVNQFNIDDGLNLVAFVDDNENGIMDGAEIPFTGGEFLYEVNNDGVTHHASSNRNVILYEPNPATSYDFSYSVFNPGSYGGLGTTVNFNDVTVANGSGITAYYFPLTIIPLKDAAVTIYGYGTPPRPGFTYTQRIHIHNSGNQLIDSGTLAFTKDDRLSITAISVTGTTPTANGFTATFANLQPNEHRFIDVTLQVPTIPTIALGDVLTNSVSIAVADDAYALNNDDVSNEVIVGSYDPNDKAENHGGKVLYSAFTADDYLTYKIRFENTGTFPAEFVRVVDVLDDKLDETSIRMVDASHSYTLTRVGKELTWMFDDIQLPPSVENTNIGHGYLVFKVKPKTGFALGDVIPNIASIYFDFNPPIVTEPCVTEFVNSLATRDFALDNFRFSPNPVKNNLKVSNDSVIDMITVTSVLGQVVFEKSVNALDAVIDLSGLSHGVYLIKATSLSATKTLKIVKE